jgi:hypothetical protein
MGPMLSCSAALHIVTLAYSWVCVLHVLGVCYVHSAWHRVHDGPLTQRPPSTHCWLQLCWVQGARVMNPKAWCGCMLL